MLHTAIGIDDDVDPLFAVQKVIEDCNNQIDGGWVPGAGILYTSNMDADFEAMVRLVTGAFPEMQLIGCTTDGELTPGRGFTEDGVALLLLGSDELTFATGLARNISENAEESIARAFEEASEKLGCRPVCGVVLPDGLTSITIPLDMIFRRVFGETFPVFGGIAGDHFKLEQTYQFHGGQVYSDAMPMLLIGGDVELIASVYTGPSPFGPFYTIDEYRNNTISRIDGRSVIDFYRDEYGEYTDMYTNFPLAVYPDDGDHYFLRNPILIHPERGEIDFVGNFPANCRIRMTQVLREDILRSAEQANRKLLEGPENRSIELILIFSCTARRHVLGSATEKEVGLLRKNSPGIPFFGFYCYGELAPFEIGLPVRFHNETFASVAFCTPEGENDVSGYSPSTRQRESLSET